MSRVLGLLAVVLLVVAPLSFRLHLLPLQVSLLLVPMSALLGLIAFVVGLTPKRRSLVGAVAGLAGRSRCGARARRVLRRRDRQRSWTADDPRHQHRSDRSARLRHRTDDAA